MKFHAVLVVVFGLILDCLVGDPEWLPHPVRWMGRLISFLDRTLRHDADGKWLQRAKGGVLVLAVLAVTMGCSALALRLAYRFHLAVGMALESVMCAQCLAARNLRDESLMVYRALCAGDITGARRAVARIVGRDTGGLDYAGIARAAVETVAENTNDGVVAPLCFLLLGGPILGMAYKAVNTMDSMLGYRDARYQFFGTAAARLDDAAGFFPARLSALAMILAAFPLGLDGRNAWRIFLRDRYRHQSPNSAQTESACAGALGVRLAGDAMYGGVLEHRPFLGDARRPIEPEDIRRANRLMYGALCVCLLALASMRLA